MLYYLGFTVAMGLVYNRIDANNKLKDYIFSWINLPSVIVFCLNLFLKEIKYDFFCNLGDNLFVHSFIKE